MLLRIRGKKVVELVRIDLGHWRVREGMGEKSALARPARDYARMYAERIEEHLAMRVCSNDVQWTRRSSSLEQELSVLGRVLP